MEEGPCITLHNYLGKGQNMLRVREKNWGLKQFEENHFVVKNVVRQKNIEVK